MVAFCAKAALDAAQSRKITESIAIRFRIRVPFFFQGAVKTVGWARHMVCPGCGQVKQMAISHPFRDGRERGWSTLVFWAILVGRDSALWRSVQDRYVITVWLQRLESVFDCPVS